MGVVREYFVRDDDAQGAALLLDGAERGVIGMCPHTELVSLEAFLMNLPMDYHTAARLMERKDHGVVVAHDDDEPWNVHISRIADHTAALIAAASTEHLAAAMEPWSQTEEFAGRVTATELLDVMALLQPLFREAVERGRHVYVRTSC